MKCIIIIGIGCGEKLKSTTKRVRTYSVYLSSAYVHMHRALALICIMNYYCFYRYLVYDVIIMKDHRMRQTLRSTTTQERDITMMLPLHKNKRLYGTVTVYLPIALISNIYELHDGERISSH